MLFFVLGLLLIAAHSEVRTPLLGLKRSRSL
jgi:hypothetical protein